MPVAEEIYLTDTTLKNTADIPEAEYMVVVLRPDWNCCGISKSRTIAEVFKTYEEAEKMYQDFVDGGEENNTYFYRILPLAKPLFRKEVR